MKNYLVLATCLLSSISSLNAGTLNDKTEDVVNQSKRLVKHLPHADASGILEFYDKDNELTSYCSAVAVDRWTLLTSAHSFIDTHYKRSTFSTSATLDDTSGVLVHFSKNDVILNNDFMKIQKILRKRPNHFWCLQNQKKYDIAVIKLKTPLPTSIIYPLLSTNVTKIYKQKCFGIGYGVLRIEKTKDRIKGEKHCFYNQVSYNKTFNVISSDNYLTFPNESRLPTLLYDEKIHPVYGEPGPGDSGSGLFNVNELIGIHQGNDIFDAQLIDPEEITRFKSHWVSISFHLEWIQSLMGPTKNINKN